MPAYLDIDRYKLLSLMPSSYIDGVEQKHPGWLAAQFDHESARIDAQLRKRYGQLMPFAETPAVVQGWLARIMDLNTWLKRGVSATDEQFQDYRRRAEDAVKEINSAANSEQGLFDLPTSGTNSASAPSLGGPRGYSEQSPYVWTDEQAAIGHEEDQQRGGSRY